MCARTIHAVHQTQPGSGSTHHKGTDPQLFGNSTLECVAMPADAQLAV